MQCAERNQTAEERFRQEISNLLFVFLLFFFIFVNIPFSSSLTSLNIFVDDSGSAVFLGETDEPALTLPNGIDLENGEITGISNTITNKEGDIWNLSYALDNSEITVILPVGAVITKLENGEISIDNNRISVFVTNQINITYMIKEANGDSNDSKLDIPLLLVFLAALLVLVVFLINFTKRDKKTQESKKSKTRIIKKQDTLEIIKQVLNERERNIIDKLKETGKIKGSQLRRMLEIPKASFSRHIQELEKKGIVKRTGEGRNRFIELAKK